MLASEGGRTEAVSVLVGAGAALDVADKEVLIGAVPRAVHAGRGNCVPLVALGGFFLCFSVLCAVRGVLRCESGMVFDGGGVGVGWYWRGSVAEVWTTFGEWSMPRDTGSPIWWRSAASYRQT